MVSLRVCSVEQVPPLWSASIDFAGQGRCCNLILCNNWKASAHKLCLGFSPCKGSSHLKPAWHLALIIPHFCHRMSSVLVPSNTNNPVINNSCSSSRRHSDTSRLGFIFAGVSELFWKMYYKNLCKHVPLLADLTVAGSKLTVEKKVSFPQIFSASELFAIMVPPACILSVLNWARWVIQRTTTQRAALLIDRHKGYMILKFLLS